MTPRRVFIGFDARELRAWNVAQESLQRRSSVPLQIDRVAMSALRTHGLYWRPTRQFVDGGFWDQISDAPMATEHAIARFLVSALCDYDGLALFCDGDVLFRADVADLFALADSRYAVQVVQHAYQPTETVKMDGQPQTVYARKNWSSVVLWNCGHPANRTLTVDLVNTVPGRDLHRFCWLTDDLIGALPARWNHLVGISGHDPDPALVHFTCGTPDMVGYEQQPFADEWYTMARACGYRLSQPVALV